MLNGIDVSHWQGKMDWAKAKAAGVQFAIIRAGSIDNSTGVCYQDDQLVNNVRGCDALGLPYALYWFFRPNQSVTKQAEYFLDLVPHNSMGLAVDLWCDIEVAGDAAKVKAFMELLDRSGMMTGIYTNANTALYLLTGDKSWMAEYELWLADWTAPANPPKPWTEWAMWQYAVKPDGAAFGAQSASIDHNQAQDWMILPPTPEPEPSNHEERIQALEALTADHTIDLTGIASGLVALTERVKALEDWKIAHEAAPPAPPTSLGTFKIGASTANARYVTGPNGAGKPIMAIKEPRVQWKPGETIEVDPVAITADGGGKYFAVVDFTPPLYVRAQDGVLQVG